MAAIHGDEFKRDAVRIATTSGLARRQVASDWATGRSTLGKGVRVFSDEAMVAAQDAELLRKNERLRHESGRRPRAESAWLCLVPGGLGLPE